MKLIIETNSCRECPMFNKNQLGNRIVDDCCSEVGHKLENIDEISQYCPHLQINKLIVIGNTGQFKCYLNIPKEEALKRFKESDMYINDDYYSINEIEFWDEFEAYDIWEL